MSARLAPRLPPLLSPAPWPPLLPPTVALEPSQLDAVLAVEVRAYPYPWSRGNFIDSLAAAYWAEVAWGTGSDGERTVLGYAIAMPGVDELHLLNLTIAPEAQGLGYGRALLARVVAVAAERGLASLLLEVREGNQRARRLYAAAGFAEIGCRRGYYPARGGREDAVVMRLDLSPAARPVHEHGLD
jgi:[ribosomal protein S18]-alanine N-acetyltransferase